MKQTLTIEQMQHLQELGLDTSNASAEYYRMSKKMDWFLVFGCRSKEELLDAEENIPAYTLVDIIEMLPSYIHISGKNYWLEIDKENEVGTIDEYAVQYLINSEKILHRVRKTENLIDAAYSMLCWCLENKYIETK